MQNCSIVICTHYFSKVFNFMKFDFRIMNGVTEVLADILTTTQLPIDRSSLLWILIVGVILAFLLGTAMGGNDVANAFGTSVGSGVLTIIQAYILASIFETLGAVLVGWSVTDTMRKGVVELDYFTNDIKLYMLGQLAILGGCAAWLFIATVFKMPVSTTHSLVGATLGFSVAIRGFTGVNWGKIGEIVGSWFISPLLSGIISTILYIIVDFSVLRRKSPLKCGLRALPVFYFVCIAFITLMVTWDGSKLLHFDQIPIWGSILIALGMGTIAALLVHFVMKPRLRRQIEAAIEDEKPTQIEFGTDLGSSPKEKEELGERTNSIRGFFVWLLPDKERQDDTRTIKLFSTIQVFTSCFAGFAHGANDVSNAIAPLAALVSTYQAGSAAQNGEVPIYVLLYGVAAICVGLWLLGHRVIRTVGTNMSEINPASGFTIEFGAAMTALLASKAGLPISTTHCLVGSVVAVGTIRSGEGVKWKLFAGIVSSWVFTLPVAGLISAGLMWLLKTFAL